MCNGGAALTILCSIRWLKKHSCITATSPPQQHGWITQLFPLLNGQAQASPTWVDNKQVMGSSGAYMTGFGASWELDLWGKLRNAQEAALAQLQATEAARQGVWLSVAAQTSNSYFLLRSLDSQQGIAERTVRTREDALGIYTARYDQGLINELDLVRARTEVEAANTALYKIRVSRDAAESALATLTGRSPRAIMDGTIKRGLNVESIPKPPVIPAGVPSDLLERRPDIRQAELGMQAANANIGVAKAAWFPTISLTGLFGIVSPQLHSLLSNPLETWSYGGSATVPLLDFGRVKSNVEAAEAKQRESLAVYEKTVQAAFQDMRDTLNRQKESTNIVDSLERTVKDLRVAVDLARVRYDNGYSSYLEVLDAERSLFDSELNLASARSDRLTAIVNVCLALGGGWK
ncbi:MAG: efflux transporter outer membrane subunit [Bilophila sp.]